MLSVWFIGSRFLVVHGGSVDRDFGRVPAVVRADEDAICQESAVRDNRPDVRMEMK